MKPGPKDRYSARIGDAHSIAENATYDALLTRLVEFTARAALARCADESDWEDELLRRKGLSALQIFRNGKAVWDDGTAFEAELTEASHERIAVRFKALNELDLDVYRRLDRDLRDRWRRAGYKTSSLRHDMKRLFRELEHDAADRANDARRCLLSELLSAQPQESK